MKASDKIIKTTERIQKELGYKNNIPAYCPIYEHYRLRAEFGIYHEKNPYKVKHIMWEKDKKFIFINEHKISSKLINKLMTAISNFMSDSYEFAFKLFQVEYLTSLSNEVIVTLIFHRKINEEVDTEKAQELKLYLEKLNIAKNINIIIRARKTRIQVGNNFITEQFIVNNKKHKLIQVENSFSQPNGIVNQEMLAFVENNCQSKKDILELYCGVGNFTMILSRLGRRILATEVNKQSIEFAKKNLEINNINNVELGRVSAEEFVQAINKEREFFRLKHINLDSYEFDTIFIDPPRSGLDNKSLDMVANYENIIYVSCNPDTLIPNLKYLLKNHRYSIEKIAIFDQFPQTPHLESIVILKKIKI